MSQNADPTADTREQQEARFLAALESRPIPVDTLVGVLRFLLSSGKNADAATFTQTLEDALVESNDRDGLLRLLRFRMAGRENDRAFGLFCRDLLRKAWKDRDAAAYLDTASFDACPPAEALRRIELLLACKPGVLCIDKTWGFGVVRKIDVFYRKISIDFPNKPGHPLSFASAAEGVALVDDAHLLARAHRDPAEIARLAREQPADVARMALRSFGPLSVVRLEQVLTEHRLVAASDWKRFWDAARKALKADPLVEIPSKRSDPILLRTQTRDYGPAWLAAFSKERDLDRIVSEVEACFEASAGACDDATRQALLDRLAFAAKGARNTDPALYAKLAALMARTGLEAVPPAEMREHLWEQNRFLRAAERLVARDNGHLARVLLGSPDGAPRLLAALETMPFSLLNETLNTLREGPDLPAAQARCRELLLSPKAPPTLIVWVFRNRESLADWPLPSLNELLAHAIVLIETPLSGESLRMQNQMRQMFDQPKWLEGVLNQLDPIARSALFDRIQASTAWDSATQRSLIGRLIRFDPLLGDRKRTGEQAGGQPAAPRLTSWRSLHARQAEYKRIVDVELPKSSQDISVARSYGDLRENFEYHAAKHAQGLLLQRQSEMDQDLRQVQGTDFSEATTDAVGMGVSVVLTYPDGRSCRFCVLGEWDRDEALGIISCKSRMALCLEGRRVGETVTVPGEKGDEATVISAIEPLDATIRAWMAETPPEPTTPPVPPPGMTPVE